MIDYLHKPYPVERFLKAVHKVQKQEKGRIKGVSEDYLYIKTNKPFKKLNTHKSAGLRAIEILYEHSLHMKKSYSS